MLGAVSGSAFGPTLGFMLGTALGSVTGPALWFMLGAAIGSAWYGKLQCEENAV